MKMKQLSAKDFCNLNSIQARMEADVRECARTAYYSPETPPEILQRSQMRLNLFRAARAMSGLFSEKTMP